MGVRLLLLFALAERLRADIATERVPGDDRALVALAGFSWLFALFAIAMRLRATDALPRIPAAVLSGVQFVAGIGFVFGLTMVTSLINPYPPPPEGWSILRPPAEARVLAADGQRVWAGGRAGIAVFDEATGHPLPLPAGSPRLRDVMSLVFDHTGVLWIAHREGVVRYSPAGWQTDGRFPAPALLVFEDRDRSIWIGTERGLFRDGAPVSEKRVSVIHQARDGALWLGSDDPHAGGLWRMEGGAWETYTGKLLHPSVNAITQDTGGALWFATGFGNKGGATRFAAGQWSTRTMADGMAGPKIRSIHQDPAGRMWFGSEYDGIVLESAASRRLLTPKEGLAGYEVKHMIEDRHGYFWLATEAGLSRIPMSSVR
jgi:ligand-binding sensor domain-containing protein